jgi:hypothetical protein
MDVDLAAATDFVWRNARLVERRVFAAVFLGAPTEGVVSALRAYQNEDGGFGHALEADLRGPDSQPIHVDSAFRALHAAGASAPEVVGRACSYLSSVASPDGGVTAILPSVSAYPRAEHWEFEGGDASLNPTAMLVGLLHAMRIGHPWLDRADTYCWKALEAQAAGDGHWLAAVFCFLNHAPDRRRAVAMAERVAELIPDALFFRLEPGAGTGYAVTPLDLAPTPDAMAAGLFAEELLAAHLDDVAGAQQYDGGWTVTWEPPGPGAAIEWRGRVTVEALLTLRAYGRV